jgi:hypothetical protein
VLAAVLGVLTLGPPAAAPPVPISGLDLHSPLVLTVNGAPDDAAAVLGSVARILQVDLGLPLPSQITVHVYDAPMRFREGLVSHASVPAARAAELAQFAIGATVPGAVHLIAPARAAPPPADWPRLIAHELTHVAQIELAEGNRGPAQWLAEGMAEWVAYRVLERLDLDDFTARRATARAAALEYVARAGGLDLAALATPDGFVARHRQFGTLLTYRLVLHLADDLVAQHGFAPLVGYFRAFRLSADAAGNFATSFGTSVNGFERAALARLATEPAAAGSAIIGTASPGPCGPPASAACPGTAVPSPAATSGRAHRAPLPALAAEAG